MHKMLYNRMCNIPDAGVHATHTRWRSSSPWWRRWCQLQPRQSLLRTPGRCFAAWTSSWLRFWTEQTRGRRLGPPIVLHIWGRCHCWSSARCSANGPPRRRTRRWSCCALRYSLCRKQNPRRGRLPCTTERLKQGQQRPRLLPLCRWNGWACRCPSPRASRCRSCWTLCEPHPWRASCCSGAWKQRAAPRAPLLQPA